MALSDRNLHGWVLEVAGTRIAGLGGIDEYGRLKKAVTAYLNGASFAKIEKDHGYTKSQIYRMLARCLTARSNGTMYGFHALIPGVSIASYTSMHTWPRNLVVGHPSDYSWVALPDPMGRARSNASSDTGTSQ
jgi:hypothetical protein